MGAEHLGEPLGQAAEQRLPRASEVRRNRQNRHQSIDLAQPLPGVQSSCVQAGAGRPTAGPALPYRCRARLSSSRRSTSCIRALRSSTSSESAGHDLRDRR